MRTYYPRVDPSMKKKHSRQVLFAALAVATFALFGAGRADAGEEPFPDTFGLRLGGYNVRSASTILRLDSANAPVGAYIDFAETLGGETTAQVIRLDGLYRFNKYHSLAFSWYDLKFTGSRVIDKDIVWGGQTYPLNTQVDSELKFNVYKVNYQYSLHHDENVELGVLVGLHVMKIGAGLNASGIGQSKTEAVTAPLPVFGFFARYNFTPRLTAYYNYQFFFINYEDSVRGGLQDFLLGVEYRLFRNLGLGLAYNRFGLDMKSKSDESTIYVNTSWNGAMLYGSVYF